MQEGKEMKKIIAVLAVIMLTAVLPATVNAAQSSADGVVTVSEDGLNIKVDFTKMETTDRMLGAIEAEDIGAVDMDVN